MLALIAGTVMQTSIQEFQMAGNAQFREEAFQRAQAIAEEISEDLDNFPVTGDVGYKICATGCNGTNFIQALTTATAPTGVNVDYQVERQGPRFVSRRFVRLGILWGVQDSDDASHECPDSLG